MDNPVIHYPFLVVAFSKLLGFWPLIPIELAMAFTSWTLFACLIAIGLHPTSRAGTAVNPTGEGFTKQKVCTDVVAGGTRTGNIELDRRLQASNFLKSTIYRLPLGFQRNQTTNLPWAATLAGVRVNCVQTRFVVIDFRN